MEKILANKDTGNLSPTHINNLYSTISENKQSNKKIKDLNAHFSKEGTDMAIKHIKICSISLVLQFSRSVVSHSLQPHGLQHASFPVHHQLPELNHTHIHRVGNAILSSHPLSSSSPPAFNLSQYQGLFQGVSSSHQVAKVLEFQLQLQSFQWIFRPDLLEDWLVGSPCGPRDSQESSPTPQFKSINSSVLSFLYSPTLTPIHDYWKNHSLD